MSATAAELFRCIPLGCKLRRSACGEKHVLHRDGSSGQRIAVCATCEIGTAHHRGETPTAWPDGTPLELVTITLPEPGSQGLTRKPPLPPTSEERARARDASGPPTADAPSERALREPEGPALEREDGATNDEPAPPSAGEGDRVGTTTTTRQGALYTYDGTEQTIAEWARDPRNTSGCNGSALKMRLRNGWSTHDALSVPKGSRPGGRRDTAAAAKTPRKRKATAKKVVGERLNELFDETPARGKRGAPNPSSAGASTLTSGSVAAIDAIVAEVTRLEGALPALRLGANALAGIHGLPVPYPEEQSR